MDSSGNKPVDPVTDEAEPNSSVEAEGQLDRSGAANGNPQPPTLPSAPTLKRASTTPLPPAPLLSPSPSLTNSPKPSREPSPIRLPPKATGAAPVRGPRSRKNSQDISPNRAPPSTIPTVPSAAAVQRALSAAGAPQLQLPANSEFSSDSTRSLRPIKPAGAGSGQPAPSIARVKSPPPPTGAHKSSLYSSRKVERAASTPSITLERSPATTTARVEGINEGEEESLAPAGMRTPHRSIGGTGATLETVQEASLPGTPAISVGRGPLGGSQASSDRPENIAEHVADDATPRPTGTRPESGSESGGAISAGPQKDGKESRKPVLASSAAKPQVVHPKRSITQLLPAKGRMGSEGMVKNMTVETETVSTIPQVSLGGGAGERTGLGRAETAGSLRLKPSTETIRPRKEKKRVARKPPSLNSGTGGSISRRFHHHHHHHIHARPPSPASTISLSTASSQFSPSYVISHPSPTNAFPPITRKPKQASRSSGADVRRDSEGISRPSSATLTTFRGRTASSKADIFEAKVASAVDEVDSSDSEETFVYESNPPESLATRPNRYHSRTPSATSMVSQMDQYGPKSRQDGHHTIAGKKSMKFANNPYHAAGYSAEPTDGTVRGTGHSGRTSVGNTSHQHYAGRFGRGGASHPSLFDTDSPFPPASRSLRGAAAHVARSSLRAGNPKSPPLLRVSAGAKKSGQSMLYDLEGEGADDERTPLVNSARSGRSRYSRRGVAGASRRSPSADEGRSPYCRRATAFVSLWSLFALLIGGIVILLSMCSKSLYDVQVEEIRNVLASEEELMLDLHVQAVNPNLIAVQVSDLDVNLFAKSRYVGTNALWRSHPDWRPEQGIDNGEASKDTFAPTFPHQPGPEPEYKSMDNVDEGTDPIEDPEVDTQTMLLGRIFEFDSPLIFEASPIRHQLYSATGGLRLANPGNKSEEGGSRRWERVLQHDFELIIRGVLRYSTPITWRPRSASISGRVMVHPGDAAEIGSVMVSSGSPDGGSARRQVSRNGMAV